MTVAHLQYICDNCATFQIDFSKTMGGVFFNTNFFLGDGQTDGQTGVKNNAPPTMIAGA